MRRAIVMGIVVLGLASCDEGETATVRTAAGVALVRGDVRASEKPVSASARVAERGVVETGADGRARVRFDEGTSALLEARTRLVITDGNRAELASGRAFFDAPPGEPFVLATPRGELRFADAQLAVTAGQASVVVNVIRGSVAHRAGQRRGIVGSGRELVLGADDARVTAAVAWEDFTGGLAAPGPRDPSEAAGVGVLEGRRPGDVGEARWPLLVRTLDVRVRVVGDLAITDVEQIFFNPASETLEGLYRIRVPADAVLHRFAVDRDGRMVDGYVREKRDAAAAYQAQVYEGSTLDPALLEWDSPGTYRARIHPIVAGESRRIAIRYSEWLPRREGMPRTYRYPMGAGDDAPSIESLSIAVDVGATTYGSLRASHGARLEGDVLRLRRSDVRPRADFVVELEGGEEGTRAYRATHVEPLRDPSATARVEPESDYFYLPLVVEPPNAEAAANAPIDLVVVADLSAGTDRSELELGRTVIESIAAQLREGDRVALVGGDLSLRSLGGGTALGAASRERMRTALDALARAPSGGASDLGAMLTEAAALLDPTRNGAVVYVGDGAPTVGEIGAGPLVERLSRLPTPLRAFGVAIGEDANAELLASITRGSGHVERVTTRAEAADAALAIVAAAARPVVSRVVVDLGTGVDRIFPRDAGATTLGEPIAIVGRVRGAVPSSAKVSGFYAGRAFERRVPLTVQTIDDAGDLRLRWAGARLERLLLDGARRTEIVDLGVRAGVITPFTSLYVPSAAELGALGPDARPLLERGAMDEGPRVRASGPTSALAWALAPVVSLFGCSNREAAPAPGASQGGAGQTAPAPSTVAADEVSADAPEDQRAMRRAVAEAPMNAPSPTTAPSAEPMPAAPPPAEAAQELRAQGSARNEGGLGTLGHGAGGGGVGDGYGRGGGAQPLGERSRAMRPRSNAEPEQGQLRETGATHSSRARGDDADAIVAGGLFRDADRREPDAAGRVVDVTTTIALAHVRRSCGDAAGLILDARVALWRERLSAAYAPDEWARLYERAIADCEAPSSRDRRKLLDLVLERAGDVGTMIAAYPSFVSRAARTYLRRAIFARIRTPDELRVARAAFGTTTVDAALVQGELDRATDDAAKVRVLRRLVARFDGDLELSMRLLATYERLGRRDDAKQLALVVRANPLTDAGIRTAVGETFLRFGDEAEARRTFSEIVEFAPNDELARRRLGDLYRAHGWFDDAYRQYQTLAALRPDDTTVLLLLAQAAAGAGRIDEALRLEQQLAETAPPGGAEGAARTALLWSSVRLAELREDARQRGDQAALRTYFAAMRHGGVSREASELRATLVWSHPDADLSLFGAHPGLGLSRPDDLSPELGLEAFDVREREPGTYRVEVRRGSRDTLTSVEATLVVVFREGRPDERVVVLPLRFPAGAATRSFVVEGDAVRDVGTNGGAR